MSTSLEESSVSNLQLEESIYGKRGPLFSCYGPITPQEIEAFELGDPAFVDQQLNELGDHPMMRRTTNPAPTPKPEIALQDRRPVALCRLSNLEMPSLGLRVLIAGDPTVKDDEARFAFMFGQAGCKAAANLDDAELVVFGGGSDVDPRLYTEEPHPATFWDEGRDSDDISLYLRAVDLGIPMFGVCRGAQFLHVMQGGTLFQHVNNHTGDHTILDLQSKQRIERVSSVHHQLVRPNTDNGMKILATAAMSDSRWVNEKEEHVGFSADIEAFFYREHCIIGVQGHPEYKSYYRFTQWCLEQIQDHVLHNPDVDFVEIEPGVLRRRIKPDIREMQVQWAEGIAAIKQARQPKKKGK